MADSRPDPPVAAPAPEVAAEPPARRGRALRLVLLDGLASEAMGTLTTGVLLVGFALELGASNLAIGVLAAVPFFVQLLQLPAVALVERLRDRRAICAWACGIGRVFVLVAAASALLPAGAAVAVLIVALAAHQALGAIAGCAWNSWMRDLVPEEQFGRYFGRRTAATTALSIALGFLAAAAIDFWKRALPEHVALGYAGLFALGGALGLYGVYLLTRTPEPPMASLTEAPGLRELLSRPFRDRNFRRVIVFLASWNFAVNLASPFFTVFLLRTLGYSMTAVIALNIVSQLSNLAFLGAWGALIDRFSNKAVLGVCAPLFLLCILAWTLVGVAWTQAFTLPLLVVLHVAMGLATAGVGLASGNIAMKLSPAGESTAYLAANGVVTSLCASVAPIIGGACADYFAVRDLTLSLAWQAPGQQVTLEVLHFHGWTFFFAIAALLGLYSLHRLSAVEESGRVDDRLALQHLFLELRRAVHGLSSAAGLARIARFPIVLRRAGRPG
jgi:MFS family permease